MSTPTPNGSVTAFPGRDVEEQANNAVKAALAGNLGDQHHPRAGESVQDTLHTAVDFDLDLFRSKEDAYSAELETIDNERQEAERNIKGWQQRLDRLATRRADVVRRLNAARAARRALEDGSTEL